jgi:hypothetical protein
MKSLSNHDIIKFFDNKVNLVLYPEIRNIKNIEELLGPYNRCVILYKTSSNYGHWVCISLNSYGEIDFFDSYNLSPDLELKFIDNKTRSELMQKTPYLSKLLIDSKYKINYNDHQFQKDNPKITTCGYWVILRLTFKDLDADEFINFIKTLELDDTKIYNIINKIMKF